VIAAVGLRICVDELSSVQINRLKSGKVGKPKVIYAEVAGAERWMWKFVVCRAAGYAELGPRGWCSACSERVVVPRGSA
jgi:hypothetical protein